MLPTLIFALITRVVSLNGKTVPVTSCCPEGSFLAIDEFQGIEGRQYQEVSPKKTLFSRIRTPRTHWINLYNQRIWLPVYLTEERGG